MHLEINEAQQELLGITVKKNSERETQLPTSIHTPGASSSDYCGDFKMAHPNTVHN
jgi:hypothetical protein